MATEFRKLCDVEQIEAASDDATVLVEDGGDIKRIAKRNLGGVTSWNNLTDKPFSVKTEMVEILPEQSVTGVYMSEEQGAPYPIYLADNFFATQGSLFEDGKTYIFNFNEKKYSGTAKVNIEDESFDIDIAEQQIHLMGYSTGNGEEWSNTIYYSADYGETITLAIYGEQEIVTPIDRKFLPEDYPTPNSVHILMGSDDTLSCNLTYEELRGCLVRNDIYFGSYVQNIGGLDRAYAMMAAIRLNSNSEEIIMDFVAVDAPTATYEIRYSPTDGLYNPYAAGPQ